MPLNDSISILKDSTSLFTDSLAKADSILSVDIIRSVDTLVIQTPLRGFVGLPHPSFPESEAWVFGTILFLFLLLVISFMRSSGWILESFRSTFQIKEHSDMFRKITINDVQSRFLLILFSAGVFSLYAYFLLVTPESGFNYLNYFITLGLCFLYLILKYLIIELLGYVFLEKQTLNLARINYFNIQIYLGILLFPLLIFQIYFPTTLSTYIIYVSLIICILVLFLFIFKLFQIFHNKAVVSFYLLLYLCTLEILPVFWLYAFLQTIL